MTIDYVSCKAGNRHILHSISATLGAAQVHVLLGPNGAGKSTLLRVLSGEVLPGEGLVLFNKQNIHSRPAAKLALERAVLTQQYAVNLPFTVREVVMMGRYPHFSRQPSARDQELVTETMQALQLGHLAMRHFHTLSGGEQQRVQLARVLVQLRHVDQPHLQGKYLLLDEPTASMDLLHQQLCLGYVQQLAAKGLTVIIVLHDLNLAAQFANNILLLAKGRIWASGRPGEVLQASTIAAVYGMQVSVLLHPDYGFPIILPMQQGLPVEE